MNCHNTRCGRFRVSVCIMNAIRQCVCMMLIISFVPMIRSDLHPSRDFIVISCLCCRCSCFTFVANSIDCRFAINRRYSNERVNAYSLFICPRHSMCQFEIPLVCSRGSHNAIWLDRFQAICMSVRIPLSFVWKWNALYCRTRTRYGRDVGKVSE